MPCWDEHLILKLRSVVLRGGEGVIEGEEGEEPEAQVNELIPRCLASTDMSRWRRESVGLRGGRRGAGGMG